MAGELTGSAAAGGALYGFSTAHVQRYVVATSRLRDIDGASQRLEALVEQIFPRAVAEVGLQPDEAIISQAAGGARVWVTEAAEREMVETLHAIWPLIADRYAPGILVEQALIDVEPGGFRAGVRRLGEELKGARSSQTLDLPRPGPVSFRCARTGRPAVGHRNFKGSGDRDRDHFELLDRPTVAKEATHRVHRPGGGRAAEGSLGRSFLPDAHADRLFADDLGTEAEPYVALIHVDGNDVGAFFRQLTSTGSDPVAAFRDASKQLKGSTRLAARRGVAAVIAACDERARASERDHAGPVPVPVRPIVLGGDDVTLAVEARYALDFVEAFVEAFDADTARWIAPLKRATHGGLTASAGIAIIKRNFPYDRGHELAESLCQLAKRWSRRDGGRSMVSLHRVTTSLPGDVGAVLANELTIHRGGAGTDGLSPDDRLTFEAYAVGGEGRVADLSALRRLAAALPYREMRGQLRTLLSSLHGRPNEAENAFGRLREVLRSRRSRDDERGGFRAEGGDDVERLDAALAALTGGAGLWRSNSIWAEPDEPALPERSTPLLDAFTLHRIGAVRGEG